MQKIKTNFFVFKDSSDVQNGEHATFMKMKNDSAYEFSF